MGEEWEEGRESNVLELRLDLPVTARSAGRPFLSTVEGRVRVRTVKWRR
jgi:hypothetical protein